MQRPAEQPEVALRPHLSDDSRPLDERQQLRKALRTRYGQVRTNAEWAHMCGRRTYPFEWIYMRHKDAQPTVHWRMPFKPKFTWPEEKITVGIKKPIVNERIDIGG